MLLWRLPRTKGKDKMPFLKTAFHYHYSFVLFHNSWKHSFFPRPARTGASILSGIMDPLSYKDSVGRVYYTIHNFHSVRYRLSTEGLGKKATIIILNQIKISITDNNITMDCFAQNHLTVQWWRGRQTGWNATKHFRTYVLLV